MRNNGYDAATIALRKRQIEVQLDDYERAIAEAAAFMEDWRRRNPPAEQDAAE